MKLPKDLSMIDKPYLVKEDIMKSDIDIMYDNFVANHDEMLAQAVESGGGRLNSNK